MMAHTKLTKSLAFLFSGALLVFALPLNVIAASGQPDAVDTSKVDGTFSFPATFDSSRDITAEFHYDSNDFLLDPYKYQEHLSTMSLCLALSAFRSNTVDYAYSYHNVKDLMMQIGVAEKDFYVNELSKVKPTTDSIGVNIGCKVLWQDEKGEDIYLIPIAVRGGGYEAEWASNVTIGTGGDCEGFSKSANIVLNEVEHYIAQKQNLTEAVEDGRAILWVAGFSRGGAVANLTSGRLCDKIQNHQIDSAPGRAFRYGEGNQVIAYTFEAPQGLYGGYDAATVKTYNCIHNVINYNDIVPLVAPTSYGFTRYGVDHYVPGLDQNGGAIETNKTQVNGKYIYHNADNRPVDHSVQRDYKADELYAELKKVDAGTLITDRSKKLNPTMPEDRDKRLLYNTEFYNYSINALELGIDKVDNKMVSEGEFIRQFLNFVLIKGGIPSRADYCKDGFQEKIRNLVYVLMCSDSIIQKLNGQDSSFESVLLNIVIAPKSTMLKNSLYASVLIPLVPFFTKIIMSDNLGVADSMAPVVGYMSILSLFFQPKPVERTKSQIITFYKNASGIMTYHAPELCLAWQNVQNIAA